MSLSGSAPGGVPPTTQADTQQQYNVAAQAGSNYNSYNPYGSTTYSQTGTGPGGVPIYSATQTLSPAQQGLLNTLQGAQQMAGTQGAQLLSGANYGSTTPTQAIGSLTSGLTQQAAGHEQAYLQPTFDYQTKQLDTQLRNQGFDPSSPAYKQAMLNNSNQQNNAMENFIATTQPQLMQQATTEYELPAALATSLSQFGSPNVAAGASQIAGAQIAPPNYESAVAQNQGAQLTQEGINNQIVGALLGGAISGGSNILTGYLKPAATLNNFSLGGTA